MSDPEWKIELSAKQSQAYKFLADPAIDEVLYGGAKGGGKSVFGCFWLFLKCLEVIEEFGLEKRKYPLPIGWMGRKQSVDFTNTTLETWKKFIPPDQYRIREHDHEVIIADTVKLDYGGFDRVESLHKFNSAEYCMYFIDQAEEVTKDEVAMLRACCFHRLVINDTNLPGKGLLTANPAQCWLKNDFVSFPSAKRRFVRALPGDNKWTGQKYVEALEEAFKHRPKLLAAYRDGDWNAFEGEDQIITSSSIVRSVNTLPVYSGWLVVCDPARFGDDDAIILLMNGTNVEERVCWGKSQTTKISGKMLQMSREHDNCICIVDETGVGGGVVDELRDYGRRVIGFTATAKAKDSVKFYNLRAEAWWDAGEMFDKGDVYCPGMYPELQTQLCIPKYDFRRGRILVESKKDIKKRLDHSPDDADCYVIGLWAQDMITSGSMLTEREVDRLYERNAPPVAAY
ncbi:MAG TPA: hypothetical protein ENH94_00325 [Phycisphaerales bacterium]|nr:hypothetical protein [Phycisphaerales bacterium]